MGGKIAIIGLGYVGLPLACLCAKKGYDVVGIDKKQEIVDKTNQGLSHIKDDFLEKELKELKGKIRATTSDEDIRGADFVLICVPTPLNDDHTPDLSYVEKASEAVAKHMKKGQVVILESTIYPGTTEEIVKPILEKSGLKTGDDFYLGHCPERVDPGNKKYTIENIPRVVGAISKQGTKRIADFYRSILKADVMELNSIKTAEATKVMENSFRDVNIAFMNEMAKSFDKAGIDIIEVIKGASTKPFAFMPHYPGAGVGGHCIPIDPYYLIQKAKEVGFNHEFLKLARDINNNMPDYTVGLLEKEISLKGAKVGVLGLAYKKDVDDLRESPALDIIKILKEKGAGVTAFDPYISGKSNVKTMEELLKTVDYLILVTDHSKFKSLTAELLKKNNIKVVIDGRNMLDKEAIKKAGIIYKGIGR